MSDYVDHLERLLGVELLPWQRAVCEDVFAAARPSRCTPLRLVCHRDALCARCRMLVAWDRAGAFDARGPLAQVWRAVHPSAHDGGALHPDGLLGRAFRPVARWLCELGVHGTSCRGRRGHHPEVGRWVRWF